MHKLKTYNGHNMKTWFQIMFALLPHLQYSGKHVFTYYGNRCDSGFYIEQQQEEM
jgi:hypothetical protein